VLAEGALSPDIVGRGRIRAIRAASELLLQTVRGNRQPATSSYRPL